MRILLITGGWSGEREVALNGAKALRTAMVESLGHTVEVYDLSPSLDDLTEAVERNDFAFINLHGSPGEDGLIQAALEQLGMPYQGSNSSSSLLALNKAMAKIFFKKAGLLVAPSLLLTKKPDAGWEVPLSYPVFIKDNSGGSTLNLEYVPNKEALWPALHKLFATGGEYLVEEGVVGAELTCGIIEEIIDGKAVPKALPPILIKANSASGLFDYESKYTEGGAEEICPAPISAELTEKIESMALIAHKALGLSGYSRADFIVPDNEEPVILEVNTLPGLTAQSLIPRELVAIGVSFAEMTERLIMLGLAKWGTKSARKGL